MSFGWLVGLGFLLGWIEDKAPLYSFQIDIEPNPDDIFFGVFSYHRMTE
jgi:hypothetical protein